MYDNDYRSKLDYYNYTNNNYNKPVYEKNMSPAELYDPYAGFIRGNMFPNLYNEYKIKPVDLNSTNPKENLKIMVDSIAFAAHDINLYLDLFPDDKDMLELFNQYKFQANQLKNEYQENYGPLLVNSEATNKYPWSWDNNPWPWEN